MTKSRNIRMPRTVWTPEQEVILRTRYAHEKTEKIAVDLGIPLGRVYQKAARMELSKTEEYLASPDASRLRHGDEVGAACRFPKGHVPANKGKKGSPSVGRMAETQFKKGNKPQTWKPIGTIRTSKEGYLQVKMADTGVTRRDYVCVHHLVWELHNGPIPDGHRITFRDGNKESIVPENLEPVSIADMMRRNTLHNYPKEIAQLIHLRGVINRKINRREKNERADSATTTK